MHFQMMGLPLKMNITIRNIFIVYYFLMVLKMTETRDVEYLERQYAPNLWSVRFRNKHDVLPYHIKYVTEASEQATNNIPNKLGIQYGANPGQKLDIFGTDLPDESAILVYLHGGYWQELSREISRYPAQPLYNSRIKTIVVGYDLCPNVTLPEIVQEIHDAARFVFEYALKMKSRGVYFAGHSAGGHLVAELLSKADFLETTGGSYLFQGAFLISGVYDLRELVYTSINDAVKLSPETAQTLSPQFDPYDHLQGSGVRLYTIAGQHDSPTFQKQAREFYKLLHYTWQIEDTYLEIKDVYDHFSIVECLSKDNNYLKKLLRHDIRKYT